MTVVALPPAAPVPAAPPLRRRVWNAMRLHMANPWPTLVTPWIIFLGVFLLTLGIWALIANAAGGVDKLEDDAFFYNGGASWVLIFLIVMAVQAMNLTFRFALGIGMTRRDYYLGTVAYIGALAVFYAVGIAVMARIELATNGWGLRGRFFAPWFLSQASAWELWYVNVVMGLLLAMVGVAAATMWVRWKAVGLYAFFGILAVVLVGSLWLVSVTVGWRAFGDWFVGRSPAEIVSWVWPVTAACGVVGYLLLRRATPRA